jgi:hypothetical protein
MSSETGSGLDRWEPPTMKSLQPLEGNPLVRCSCGRSVNADMMRPTPDGFACDSCHETMFRTGELTREEFAQAHGAPAAVQAKARALDAARTSLPDPAGDRQGR